MKLKRLAMGFRILIVFTALGTAVLAQGEKKMQDYVFPLSSTAWSGSSPDAAAGQLRWEYGKSASVTIKDVIHDWSAYNSLVFTLRSSKASDSRLYIIIPSEDKDKEGMDYFAATLKLDFEGERAF